MTKRKIERKIEDIMRYDSNSYPLGLNWQQDLQKLADEKRACAQKLRNKLSK